MRYLLDTNILSEPTKPEPSVAVMARLQRDGPDCATSSLSWHELWYGVSRLPVSQRRAQLEEYLRNLDLPLFSYDPLCAQTHGLRRAQLEHQGLSMSFADGQIAAIAEVHGLVVVTRNTHHFRHYPSIRLENWFLDEA
jgi:tRNA(fMet)-specific endonuclease VapC